MNPFSIRTSHAVRLAAIITSLALPIACASSDQKIPDTIAANKPAQSASPRFTMAEFGHLKWIIGQWRGHMADGRPFYDAFSVVDDSTIRFATYTDSTFKVSKDSALIGLRGGMVLDRGNGTPWIATRLDSNMVNFASSAVPANHFAWERESADTWRALTYTTNSKTGIESRATYEMARVPTKR